MIRITSTEVVNATPPAVASRIDVVSWLSITRMLTVLSGYLAMTLISLPATPPLAPLSAKESAEEWITLDNK